MISLIGTNKPSSFNRLLLLQILHVFAVIAFYSGVYLIFFSTVLFSGRLLAPGDGIFCYFPNFIKGIMLWDPMLFSGYPIAADPQAMLWYPISIFFSSLGSWNGYVLSAYILGSSFMYGYIYTVTLSRLAGLVSGLIYGMSGFMMVHLGHTTIIHSASWVPLMLWAVEKQRLGFSPFGFGLTCFSITLTALSGHPQIFAYAFALCTAYVGFFGISLGKYRWRYYGQYLMAILIGLAMASILLIPASEFISQTSRSQMSFDQFVSYSLPPNQIIQLIFPFLFGGLKESFYGFSYWGQWNLAEITGYVGLLSFLLIGIGVSTYWKKLMGCFWIGIGIFSFLLVLGDLTPLPKIIYILPILNKFQAIGRYFLLVTLAVSVLSGLGVMAIQKQRTSKKSILTTLSVGGAIMLFAITYTILLAPQFETFVASQDIEKINFLPWSNPAVGVPLVVFILGGGTLFYWYRNYKSKFRQILLVSVLIIDLGSFSWFVDWKYHSPEKMVLKAPPSTQRYKSYLQETHQRIVPVQGVMGSLDANPPNLSKVWGLPSISGYASLILTRITKLLSMSVPDGRVSGDWSSLHNRSLDVLATRYIFIPKSETLPIPIKDPNGISWLKDDLNVSLGMDCGPLQPTSIKINLPTPLKATSIGMVSALACSTHIQDGTKVIEILIKDTNEKIFSVEVLAGRDTAEWAFDFPDVFPFMKHKKAKIFLSFPVKKENYHGQGHRYVTDISLKNEIEIKELEFRWVGSSGAIAIQKLSLHNKEQKHSYPISLIMSDLNEQERWKLIEEIGEVRIYENLRAMPRVWLVPEVMSLKADHVLSAIRSSRLPDGRVFNPFQVALVEESFAFKENNWDPEATAKVVHLSNTKMEIQTNSIFPSFLVISDVYYPGWEATVNGINTHLFQTNYVLRGIFLPSGSHIVHLEFKSKSFYYGVGISAGTTALLILILIVSWLKSRKSGKNIKEPPLFESFCK